MEILIVTIPQNTKYETIKEEMDQCNFNNDIVLNHKLGRNKPKKQPSFIVLVYKGEMRFIGKLIEYEQKEFKCSTTGTEWSKSWYAVFNDVYELGSVHRYKIKGFQGFRYIDIDIVGSIDAELLDKEVS
jgi:hypothetical protein